MSEHIRIKYTMWINAAVAYFLTGCLTDVFPLKESQLNNFSLKEVEVHITWKSLPSFVYQQNPSQKIA